MKFGTRRGGGSAKAWHGKLVVALAVVLVLNGAAWGHANWEKMQLFQHDDSISQPPGDPGPSRLRGAFSEEETCSEPAKVDASQLERWWCTRLNDSCLDQGRILIHTGQKSPGHPNYTEASLFGISNFPGFVLPGYPEPYGYHFRPSSFGGLDIRAPTPLDPEDVWQPEGFNNCTVPLIFWPHYFSIYGTFFTWRVAGFYKMSEDKVFDQSVKFVVDSHGMELPAYYQTHLEPFTKYKVESLASLSSRERIHEGRSRCYKQLLLCNMMYYDNDKLAAHKIVDYYRERNPEKFKPSEDSVFRVAFFKRSGGMRKMLNQEEVMRNCSTWQLPQGSKFTSVDCYLLDDFPPDKLVDSLAQLQRVHALISMHGSGMANAFFLPNNSAVIEIMCWNFCGWWPNMHYRRGMEIDQHLNSGYFRLVGDKDHCFPGKYETKKIGSYIGYARDQDVLVEFDTLAKALTKIALGQTLSLRANWQERHFNMTRGDECEPPKQPS